MPPNDQPTSREPVAPPRQPPWQQQSRGQQPQQQWGQQSPHPQQYQQQYQQPAQQPAQYQQQPPQQTGGAPMQTTQPQQYQQPQQAGQQRPQQAGARRSLRLSPVTIEDLVQTDVVTARRDTPVATVVAEMAEKDVGSVVVVEEERPVGIVTDRQVALSLEQDPNVSERSVGDIVTEDLVTGTTDMTVSDVVQQLGDAGVRRLPIVDENGALAGIVTLDDILVFLGSEFTNATEVIEAQASRL